MKMKKPIFLTLFISFFIFKSWTIFAVKDTSAKCALGVGGVIAITAFSSADSALSAFLGAKMISNDYDGYDTNIAATNGAIGGAVIGLIVGSCIMPILVLLDKNVNKIFKDKQDSSFLSVSVSAGISSTVSGILGHSIQEHNNNRVLATYGKQAASSAAGAVPAIMIIYAGAAVIALFAVCVLSGVEKMEATTQEQGNSAAEIETAIGGNEMSPLEAMVATGEGGATQQVSQI